MQNNAYHRSDGAVDHTDYFAKSTECRPCY